MSAQKIGFQTCIRFNKCNPDAVIPKCLHVRLDDFNRNRLTRALKSYMLSNSFQLDPSRRMHVKGLDFEGLCSFIQQEPWSRVFAAKTRDNRRRNALNQCKKRLFSPAPTLGKGKSIKSLKWTERLNSWTWEKKLDHLVSLFRMVSSNSDVNVRNLCLYVALVMKLLKLLGRKDLFRELIQILDYQ
jgi:hypothetical protein